MSVPLAQIYSEFLITSNNPDEEETQKMPDLLPSADEGGRKPYGPGSWYCC